MRNDRVSLNLKKTARTDVNQSERFVFHTNLKLKRKRGFLKEAWQELQLGGGQGYTN